MSKYHDLSGEKEDQLLITTDKYGNKIKKATRKECHTGIGIPHLAFLAILSRKKGSVYIQKRSNKKSLWSNHWDASVVSHVLPGETIEEAAKRRGMEELGVEVEFKDLGGFYYFAQYGDNCENEYCHVLVGRTDKDIHPNPVEISQVQEVKIEVLKKDIRKNSHHYTPWLKIALEKFELS